MKTQFFKDLKRLCVLVEERDFNLNQLLLEKNRSNHPIHLSVKQMLQMLDLSDIAPNRLALLSRLVHLQEGPIIQILKKNQKTAEQIKDAKKQLFAWVMQYHTKCHENIIRQCEQEQLLTPFYRAILRGTHQIGQAFNQFHFAWKMQLIEEINPALLKEYGGDEFAVLKALESIKEVSVDGEVSDRSYSIPHKEGGTWKALPYVLAFKVEVAEIKHCIDTLISQLSSMHDEVFNAKAHYIAYYQALRDAITQEDVRQLLKDWRMVDWAWMNIKTPIQPAHPFEYYEDHFRKSVAPEWDVRITHINEYEALPIKTQMQGTFKQLYCEWSESECDSMKQLVCESLERTDLYMSLPALYYGAEMDGLFSAQVIPNDEFVSSKTGKKIFAFPMRILRSSQYRPFMKLAQEIFPKDFLKERRDILFLDERKWHSLYQISTVGHEFGHIFWIDQDTELLMNMQGCFKNIEEFKATTGGLVNFFMNDYLPQYVSLKQAVMGDLISRSVGLIAWMEQDEVQPYYCEGLIHLHILFEARVLSFVDGHLLIQSDHASYEALKALYLVYYKQLAQIYMLKKDAICFLERFTVKDENNHYKPHNQEVRTFVEYYWERYQAIGQEVQDDKEHEMYLQQNYLGKVG